MIATKIVVTLMITALLTLPAAAKGSAGPDLSGHEPLLSACYNQMATGGANWLGWHRDFGAGYADNFQLYTSEDEVTPSTLKVSRYTDGIVREDTTWCYRPDGSLAVIVVTMRSPDMTQGGETGPLIAREGRLYFDEEGNRIAVRGWLADADGKKIGAIDSEEHQLARGCNLVDLRLSVDDAEREYLSVLGDIEGDHPAYTADELDWCAEAAEGP